MTGEQLEGLFHDTIELLRPHAGYNTKWTITNEPFDILCSCGTKIRTQEGTEALLALADNDDQRLVILEVVLAAGGVAIEYGRDKVSTCGT